MKIEVADDPETRRRGMSGSSADSMIFVMDEDAEWNFWNSDVKSPLFLYGFDPEINLVDKKILSSSVMGEEHVFIRGKYIVEVRADVKEARRLEKWIYHELYRLRSRSPISKKSNFEARIPFYIQDGYVHLTDEKGTSWKDAIRSALNLHPFQAVREMINGYDKINGLIDLSSKTIYIYSKYNEDVRAFYNCSHDLAKKVGLAPTQINDYTVELEDRDDFLKESRKNAIKSIRANFPSVQTSAPKAKQAIQKFPIDPPGECAGCNLLMTYQEGGELYCKGNYYEEEGGVCRKNKVSKKQGITDNLVLARNRKGR